MPDSLPARPAGPGCPSPAARRAPEPGACPAGHAGRHGLPLSVWPGVPGPAPAPAAPAPCPAPVSRPGRLAGDHRVLPPRRPGRDPRRRTARRLPRRPPAPAAASSGSPPPARGRGSLAWDPGLPRRPLARPCCRPPCCWSRAGRTRGQPPWPSPRRRAPARRALYAACQRVLRPGGVLAVIAAPARARRDPVTGPGPSPAPAPPGCIYAQHIILIHAAHHRRAARPLPAPRPPARRRGGPPRRPHPQRPARVHQARRP